MGPIFITLFENDIHQVELNFLIGISKNKEYLTFIHTGDNFKIGCKTALFYPYEQHQQQPQY